MKLTSLAIVIIFILVGLLLSSKQAQNSPNVPYSLFFHQGYAIHGAYWHNDFGIKRRSSGCINLKPEEAGVIYNWAGPAMTSGEGAVNSTSDNPGVRVVVHE